MITEQHRITQIESHHLAGNLSLVELQNIVDNKEPTTKYGRDLVEWVQQDLISMDKLRNLVTHIEECSTNDLMRWG
jgi:hypothetical protein